MPPDDPPEERTFCCNSSTAFKQHDKIFTHSVCRSPLLPLEDAAAAPSGGDDAAPSDCCCDGGDDAAAPGDDGSGDCGGDDYSSFMDGGGINNLSLEKSIDNFLSNINTLGIYIRTLVGLPSSPSVNTFSIGNSTYLPSFIL